MKLMKREKTKLENEEKRCIFKSRNYQETLTMISVSALSKYPEAKRTFSSPMASLPLVLLDRKYKIKSCLCCTSLVEILDLL